MSVMAIKQSSTFACRDTSVHEVETGNFAPPTSPRETFQSKQRIVIATYNIRYAVGSFLITGSFLRRVGLSLPRRRPSLVARHLKIAANAFSNNRQMPTPDIVALQEADRGTLRAGGHHIARELAAALKMNYARAAMVAPPGATPKSRQWYLDFEERIAPSETGDTGIAILSRLPFTQTARIDLPWSECAWRPRLALAVSVTLNDQQIHIFNAHIDTHAALPHQLAQHEAVLEQAREMSKSDDTIILLGDYNTLTSTSRASARALFESHDYQTALPTGTATWRAGLFRKHTDWIFTRGAAAKVTRWGVLRPLGVSDHWPVWIEIDMRSGEC